MEILNVKKDFWNMLLNFEVTSVFIVPLCGVEAWEVVKYLPVLVSFLQ